MYDKEVASDIVPQGRLTLQQGHYKTRLDYYPKKKSKIAELEVGSTKSQYRYFRLGLYPPKFAAGEFAHFKAIIDLLLPFTYLYLFENGRVSYLEIAVDSMSHQMGSFIAFKRRCNCSSVYQANGTKGTAYLGSSSSKQYFRIYDKRRHLLEKSLPEPFCVRTRIESVSRYLAISPSALGSLSNPFVTLEIADLVAARKSSSLPAWHGFLDRCEEVGSPHALRECQKGARKEAVMRLRTCSAGWWRPGSLWLHYPKAIASIAP